MSEQLTIRTNNIPRPILYGYELPKKQRENFDWIKDDEEYETHQFVKYKNDYFSLSEFMRLEHSSETATYKGKKNYWHGYYGFSFSCGLFIRLVDDESVIIAYYY